MAGCECDYAPLEQGIKKTPTGNLCMTHFSFIFIPMKTLEIQPMTSRVDADIAILGSKSITNRVLLIAALADGVSHLNNALMSDDTRYMANALRDLGIRVETSEAAFRVYGTGGLIPADHAKLHIGNSGHLSALSRGISRPGQWNLYHRRRRTDARTAIQDLLDGLTPLGVTARCEGKNGLCPPPRSSSPLASKAAAPP